MSRFFELAPAYGRDYRTAKDVKAAWSEGKDFEGDFQLGFKPVNVNDIPRPCTVVLRFARNAKFAVVKIGAKS